jgi:peptide deformylase
MNQRTDIVPYELVFYGSEVLRKVAEPVIEIDQGVISLIESMFHVMHRERGIGLAAPQVAVSQKILTINLEVYRGPSLSLINPEIIGDSGDEVPFEEGCLSVPGIMKEVLRPGKISVKGLNTDGKEIQVDADGLLARVLQHEIDHLNGILFVDRLEDYIRKELTPELKKIKKLNRK